MRSLALAFPVLASAFATALFACSAVDTPEATPEAPPEITTTEQAGERPVQPTPDAGTKADATRAGPSGCGEHVDGVGEVVSRTVTAEGRARTYHLSIPRGYDPAEAHPLVIVLHGATDTSPEHMKSWFPVEAALPGAIGVYPQALARPRADGTGGNVTRWDVDGDEDLLFFDAMLSDIRASTCLDDARVFATGFSSGGNFAHQLGCLRSDDVRAIAPVAGPGPFEPMCPTGVAVWMTHDQGNPALSVEGARAARDFWRKTNGCTGTWNPDGPSACRRDVSCPATTPLVYCETSGVGHDVPAFAAAAIGAFFAGLTP